MVLGPVKGHDTIVGPSVKWPPFGASLPIKRPTFRLAKTFHEWEEGKVNCFALSDLIHEFHENASRELYKAYVMFGDHRALIVEAIKSGVLSECELPAEVLQCVQDESKQ